VAFITLRQLLDDAAEKNYGVPAFNVSNLETVKAVMDAAEACDSPVILQASRGALNYAGPAFIRALASAAVGSYPAVPVCLHLDHGTTYDVCVEVAELGFTSVMLDGSLEADGKTPASYDYNVELTARTVAWAHARGISVEGELGVLGSLETGEGEKEDGHGFEGKLERESLLTDPEQARDFVARTRVDALAVAIGTSHGAYKFSRKPTGDILAMDVIEAIHAKLPNTHLVMHGASSVPEDLQAMINHCGGEMPPAFGVPLEEVVRGIGSGVRKVNIDTDIRIAMTAGMRKALQDNKREIDLRKIVGGGTKLAAAMCRERFEQFGSAGHGAALKPLSLDAMAQRYG
jgi:fructose-bisphosphate aldolase class II